MDRRIEIIIATMENELAAAWDVATLARLVNLSASRLRHLFKQETGTTPVHFLRDLRLKRAGKLLRTTFLSVKEVMSKVGLASGGHSVRVFKNMYGVTPTVYRSNVVRSARTQNQRRKNR